MEKKAKKSDRKNKESKEVPYVPNVPNIAHALKTANLSLPAGQSGGHSAGKEVAAEQPKQKNPEEMKKEFEALRKKLDEFKKDVLKKFKFTMALGLLPGNAFAMFEEDEELPKEIVDTKPLHLIMIIPEEEYKNIPKIKPEVLKMLKETKENIWLHIKTPVDLWNYGLDSKFEFLDAVSASFPIHDNGFLGALRVANIHKSLVLRKFEKYVTSYVIAGSLVRGTAVETSDVDIFVVIDDTDVKKMGRMELLDRLRGIIYDYIKEATALAGVKNVLSPQVYLLTDFWQSVKDAHPVMFTFIRDGIPLYDRGTFLPWKMLLRMGKIKPSPEAIDLYIKQGDQTYEIINRRLIDAMIDVYYGVLTPAQAMMMLAGHAPPTHKEAPSAFKEAFFTKEKLVDEKICKILEKAVRLFKEYEHGTLKTISGKEVDKLVDECKEFNKAIIGLRKKLEKKLQEKSAEEIYDNVFTMLKTIFGNMPQDELVKMFEVELSKKGKIEPRFLKIVRELADIKKKMKAGKLNMKEVDAVKRDAIELVENLTEYAQRANLVCEEKGTMIQIEYSNGRKAELVLTGKENFLIEGKSIKKIVGHGLKETTREELEKALAESKGKLTTRISGELFDTLEKVLGKFEMII